jgi:hypothetical protein|tara:strand:- start:610 stop:807 length:198 start_codon:yes stop_codon:yes gene_type:complete
MKIITVHTFTAYGKSIQIEELGSMGSTMEEANRQLLWSNPKSKKGAWFQDGIRPVWEWAEGNYFD